MAKHSLVKILLIVTMVTVWTVMVAVHILSTQKTGREIGLFLNTTGRISDRYYTQITPADWTLFSIYGIICAWQAIWQIYVLATICLQVGGRYLYQIPALPAGVYAVFIVNNLANIAWIIMMDRENMTALGLIVFCTFALYVCLAISHKRLYQNLEILIENYASKEIWFVRLFIQNGMAFYAAWVTVASLINFVIVLEYDVNVDQELSSTIALGILSFGLVFWYILDNFVLDKYVRYTFSPYITLVIYFSGCFAKNYNLETMNTNSIFVLVLLCVTAVALVSKIHIMLFRLVFCPIVPYMDCADYDRDSIVG